MPSEVKVDKLIRQTTEGGLQWTSGTPPRSLTVGTEHIIGDYFKAEYKGQDIAVFERRYRSYDGDRDDIYWTSQDCFALVSEGQLLGR